MLCRSVSFNTLRIRTKHVPIPCLIAYSHPESHFSTTKNFMHPLVKAKCGNVPRLLELRREFAQLSILLAGAASSGDSTVMPCRALNRNARTS